MGRRGRPYSKDPRKKHYMVRLNEEEDKILKEKCKEKHMTTSEFFRTFLRSCDK